ncbi:LLM class flavin-dependent oxidoreductase [Cumulibacter manganitolerans]|uniref:LLM class flavin-dependent oxidoreductase n=1 Tax=Cumulibacter manganitolerans TaxID=1884992 RepID=UPI001296BECA|nr:LLM class flavin-dependent oxidoreductase [Cumulibacter manganitolerans]
MRVGVTLGRDQQQTAAQARTAEEQGFDLIAAGEHLFFHGPVSNGLISLAAAAGATTRIRLMSALTLAAQYQPAMLAKLVTTLDQVSGGRLDFGVGVGGEYPPEWVAAGSEVRTRGRRTDETLDLLTRLWTGEPVDFHGEFVTVPGLALQPGPVQPGGPPIWLGGRKDAAIRRAARYAAHWLPYMYAPEQLGSSLIKVREEAERIGREPSEIRGAVYLWGAVDPDGSRSRQWAIDYVSKVYNQDFTPLADRYLLHGSPQQVVDRIGAYAEAGAQTVIFAPVGDDRLRTDIVETFAAEVLPLLRADGAR